MYQSKARLNRIYTAMLTLFHPCLKRTGAIHLQAAICSIACKGAAMRLLKNITSDPV